MRAAAAMRRPWAGAACEVADAATGRVDGKNREPSGMLASLSTRLTVAYLQADAS